MSSHQAPLANRHSSILQNNLHCLLTYLPLLPLRTVYLNPCALLLQVKTTPANDQSLMTVPLAKLNCSPQNKTLIASLIKFISSEIIIIMTTSIKSIIHYLLLLVLIHSLAPATAASHSRCYRIQYCVIKCAGEGGSQHNKIIWL